MKGLVLAGGSGTRLRPFTHTSAKQLVPVANEPVLFYGLRSLAEAGVTEVGVVVGDTAGEVERAVGTGCRFGLEVTYLQQARPLGLAHAVLIGRDYLGADDFVMYLGDNVILGGITELVERFRADRPAAQLLLTRVADPRAFGVATVGVDGRVVGVEEKPSQPRSDLAVVGVYVFTPLVHDVIAELEPSARGELEITDAIGRLIHAGHRVNHTVVAGFWKDTGTVADLLDVNRAVLDGAERCVEGSVDAGSELVGRVVVRPGAQIRGTRIVGPVVIGEDAVVEDCYVGPYTSIGERCRLADSEVEYSIVLPGASIRGVRRIEASLIGRDVVVGPAGAAAPRTHRLVLGDHSRVQIAS
nr:putative glucose-1-phosphate thymidylyltransferase [uncultured bacterium]